MEKMSRKSLHVTIPPEILAELKKQAEQENRNLSNMATVIIERGLKIKAA